MKKLLIALFLCAGLAFAGCKGNPNTSSGDSTGTGAAGARVPGKESADTTRRGPAIGADAKDTSKTHGDTAMKK
jgi:hypothetical protein